MLSTTYDALKAVLKADPSIAVPERNQLLAVLRNGPPTLERNRVAAAEAGPRLLRRREAAHRLGLSVRSVDKLAQVGTLKRRVLPGRKRAAGYLESDIAAIIIGGTL